MNKSRLGSLTAALGMAAALVMSASTAQAADSEIHGKQTINTKFAEGFPKQYNSWKKTEGGAKNDALAADPRLVVLWAGYGFSKDYNAPRGHMNAVDDVRQTLRTGAPKNAEDGPMPMACWSCKSTDVPRRMEEEGYMEYFKGKWARSGDQIVNPIGCVDCHDADSPEMELKISRPYLQKSLKPEVYDIEKASKDPKQMQSLVCAQCHVEYYFDKGSNEVIFPWDYGTKVEDMEKFFDEYQFADWTHTISRTPMLKAQHPDWELWREGVHGKNNVSCTDCHSPKVKDKGGVTHTDHQIQSPLANLENTCLSCHTQSKEYLLKAVADHKTRIAELRIQAEDLIVMAHIEAGEAWKAGATEKEMKQAQMHIRHAQWRWDFAAASHGGAFHAPEETLRVLGTSIQKAGLARVELARILAKYNVKEVAMPDLSTKAKAQAYIGLDMDKLNKEKEEFKKNTLPKWDAEAKEKGRI